MKATTVKALEGFSIRVTFDDGVDGVIDLSELVEKGIFRCLLDKSEFDKVFISGNAIAWSGELEIDADNIYAEILNQDPSQFLHKPEFHAAD